MADFRLAGDACPVAPVALKQGSDFGIKVGAHAAIVAKVYDKRKQHFTNRIGNYADVQKKPINVVIADSLKHYMAEKWNNLSLAKAAGVSEGTIRNCLEPEKRKAGAKGKEPSVKATELAKIAAALDVTVADLVSEPLGVDSLLKAPRVDAQTMKALEMARLYLQLPAGKARDIAYSRIQAMHVPPGDVINPDDHPAQVPPVSPPTPRRDKAR